MFRSYCKNCWTVINWFLSDNKGRRCTDCDELNTKEDLISSLFNDDILNYKLMKSRIEKIEKIRKK